MDDVQINEFIKFTMCVLLVLINQITLTVVGLCDVSTRAHAGRSLYHLAFATKEICIAAGTASAAIDVSGAFSTRNVSAEPYCGHHRYTQVPRM